MPRNMPTCAPTPYSVPLASCQPQKAFVFPLADSQTDSVGATVAVNRPLSIWTISSFTFSGGGNSGLLLLTHFSYVGCA